MFTTSRGLGFVAVSCALASVLVASASAGVIVVGTGPGTQYTQIQAAVNAAADGDTILVRSGSYSGFTIDTKSLTVQGDGTTRPQLTSGIIVRNLTVGRAVVLASLAVTNGNPAGLSCTNDSGPVRVVDCALTGYFPYLYGDGGQGAQLTDDPAGIAFERCTLKGGHGADGWLDDSFGGNGGNGGDGVRAKGSQVALYDCTLEGGKGGGGVDFGGRGGDGAHLSPSTLATFVSSSGCTFTGGTGGDTYEDIFLYIAVVGDGGDGLEMEASTATWSLDNAYTAGPAGQWHTCPPANNGSPGVATRGPGQIYTFNQQSIAMSAPSLVRESSSMTFTFTGEPGDQVFLFAAERTRFLAIPSWRGVLVARPSHPMLHMKPLTPELPFVVLDATGHGTVVVPVPALDPGVASLTTYLQAYRVSASGSITLGSFLPITVVDSAY